MPFPSTELWRKRLADPMPGLFSLVACVDAEIVGHLGLHLQTERPRRRHAAEIGMAVRDDRQRRGVGSALLRAAIDLADNWLNLRRLELEVFVDNAAAIALYEKFGFHIEGTMKDHSFCEGRYVDAHVMGRIAPAAIGARQVGDHG